MTLEIRPASADDLPRILELCRRALGWSDMSTRFLEWKHLESPFGPSLMMVAVDGGRVVGFRAFLRWEFVDDAGNIVRSARAVDTATDPDHRRRGLFRSLTLDALEALRAEGTSFVWNTPNATSLSGYLTMGWQEVGRIPVAVAPASARFPFVVMTARRAAGRDAVATSFGRSSWDVLGDDPAVDVVLSDAASRSGTEPASRSGTEPASRSGLATHKTQAFLAWRYNNPALGYRVLLHGSTPNAGFVVFRLRRRGRAVEAVLCDLFVPSRDSAAARALVRAVARGTAADYVIQIAGGVTPRGFVRLPRTGPVLACRTLDGPDGPDGLDGPDGPVPPALGEWALTMGDVELL
jgi:GNAT superfamily N-acetyltransferase